MQSAMTMLPKLALFIAVSVSLSQAAIGPLPADARSFRFAAEANTGHLGAVKQQPVEAIFPELIIGGEWASTVRLTNRGTAFIPTTKVFFVDNSGNPMQATFQMTGGSTITDVGFTFSLAVGQILETTFVGRDTVFGFALVDGSAINFTQSGLYAEIALRNRNAVRPDFEAVFPLEQPSGLQYMLFDGRNGYTTVLYLVNANPAAAGVSIEVVDANGTIRRTVNLTMRQLESQLQLLHVIAPETVGIQGTLVIRAQARDSFFVATALRINPSNSFTPQRAWVPAQ
jgi:hypothetical protein